MDSRTATEKIVSQRRFRDFMKANPEMVFYDYPQTGKTGAIQHVSKIVCTCPLAKFLRWAGHPRATVGLTSWAKTGLSERDNYRLPQWAIALRRAADHSQNRPMTMRQLRALFRENPAHMRELKANPLTERAP